MAKLEEPHKIQNEARMIADDIARGTTRREKYPCLKEVHQSIADASQMELPKLQKIVDTNVLTEYLEKRYKLRAEEIGATSAETNDQDGGTDAAMVPPIPGSRSSSEN
jgi:hypothetical protein